MGCEIRIVGTWGYLRGDLDVEISEGTLRLYTRFRRICHMQLSTKTQSHVGSLVVSRATGLHRDPSRDNIRIAARSHSLGIYPNDRSQCNPSIAVVLV